MKNLPGGILTWAQLGRSVENMEDMTIGQGEIAKPLNNLEDAGFVAKCEEGTISYTTRWLWKRPQRADLRTDPLHGQTPGIAA